MSASRLSQKHPHRRWPGSGSPSPPRRPERLHCWAGRHSGVRLPEQQARPNRCGCGSSSQESGKLPSRPYATGRSAGQHLSFSMCREQGRGMAWGGRGASCPGLAGHPLHLLRPSPWGSGRERGTEQGELSRPEQRHLPGPLLSFRPPSLRAPPSPLSSWTPRALPVALQLPQPLGSPARPTGHAQAGDTRQSAQAQQGRWLVLESWTSDRTPLSPGVLYSK